MSLLALLAIQVSAAVGPEARVDRAYVRSTDTHLGYALAAYGDWDTDGHDDFLVSAPRPWNEEHGSKGRSRVLLVSGRDASVLVAVRVEGWWNTTQIGALGDLDGDGAREIVVSGASTPVYLVSGRTGALLRTIGESAEAPSSAAVVKVLGDVDGDGVGDIGRRVEGRLHVLSSRTGASIGASLPLGAAEFAGAPDLDGDGVDDLVWMDTAPPDHDPRSSARAPGRLKVVSLRETKLLREIVLEHECNAQRVQLAVDWRSGRALVGVAKNMASSRGKGDVWLASLRTADLPRALEGHVQSPTFGYSVDFGGDVDRDGIADPIVASVTHFLAENVWGGAWVFSGANGAILRQHKPEAAVWGDPYSAVAFLGDLDGDRVADYACAAVPQADPTSAYGSQVDIFSGASGKRLFKLPDAWDKLDAPTKR
jgi:hypothetical protein